MSTIKVDNIRIASESVSRPVTGVAAAWINFNGDDDGATDPASMIGVRASLNISSLLDGGSGQYRTDFTNLFDNTNYSVVGSAENDGSFGHAGQWHVDYWMMANRNNTTNDLEDEQYICIVAHGDLA